MRHTPRLVPILTAGVLLALVAAVVVVLLTPAAENYSAASSIGYLTFVISMVTLPASAGVWLALERRSRTHEKTYLAEPVRDDAAQQTGSPAPAPSERTDENGPR